MKININSNYFDRMPRKLLRFSRHNDAAVIGKSFTYISTLSLTYPEFITFVILDKFYDQVRFYSTLTSTPSFTTGIPSILTNTIFCFIDYHHLPIPNVYIYHNNLHRLSPMAHRL